VTFERNVRLTRLPEMRLAYMEHTGPAEEIPELWERFNEWRVTNRPDLGRIEIAGIGWLIAGDEEDEERVTFRALVPVRSSYEAPPPARTMFFPGGQFAYCYADDVDETDDAMMAVADWMEANGYEPASGPMQLYKFHYNLDQHPCDCGFLVEKA